MDISMNNDNLRSASLCDSPPAPNLSRIDFNWSDVKGVYKNCRGIWAAQWTDEKGQRHTKYFNPKFYASEATAKLEAYKFKVQIQREIELKGGVQKKRGATAEASRLAMCARRRVRRRSDIFTEGFDLAEMTKRISRRGGVLLPGQSNTQYDYFSQPRYAMAPNGSLVPIFSHPGIYGSAGATADPHHHAAQADPHMMSVLHAFGHTASLRSNEWQLPSEYSPNNRFFMKSAEPGCTTDDQIQPDYYHRRPYTLFKTPPQAPSIDDEPWNNETEKTVQSFNEKTVQSFNEKTSASQTPNTTAEDPPSLTSFWPYEPTWSGMTYISYPERAQNYEDNEFEDEVTSKISPKYNQNTESTAAASTSAAADSREKE